MILNYPNWGTVVWSIDAFFISFLYHNTFVHKWPKGILDDALGIWLNEQDRILAQSMYNHGSSNFYEKE